MNFSNRKVTAAWFHIAPGRKGITGNSLEAVKDKAEMQVTELGLLVKNSFGETLLPFGNILGVTFEPEAKSEASKDSRKVSS